MSTTTLSVKVPAKFAKEFRKFCETHFLQVGKFTEHALGEMMEDFHFGTKAQNILSQHQGQKISHSKYFKE
jgi:hypothetical protein